MRGGGDSKPSVKGLSGYTLAEVVVVMLIIAAIVAVSIRITRSKLDSVIFYTYYSAYETLKSSTASILADYNPENDDYILTYKRDRKPFGQRLLAYGKQLINNLTPKAFASSVDDYLYCPAFIELWNPEYSIETPLKIYGLKNNVTRKLEKYTDYSHTLSGTAEMCPPSMYQDMEEFINCPGKYKTIYGTLDKKSNPNSCTSKCWNVRAGVLEYTGENNCGPYVSNSVAFCHSGYTTSYDGGLVCADSNENFYYNICNSQGMTSEDAAIIAEAQGVTSDKRYSFGFSATSFFIACHLHYEDEPDEPSEGGDTDPTNPGGGEDGGSDPDPDNPGDGGGGGSDPDSPEHCTQSAPTLMPCGKRWDTSSCSLVDVTPFPPTCDEGYEFNSKDEVCACVSTARTIPRKGANFCKLFAERINTKSNTIDCGGSAITSDKTDFSSDTPDIVLRNGIKIYNMSQNPAPIPVLANNIDGGFYKDGSGNNVKINEYGYTVYVDVDGNSGDSILWQDVYPFYITMSGRVIPAYDKNANPDGSGGDSKQHLQVSVLHEMIADSGYWKRTWLAKSVSFQEGACIDGYVGENTPYCSNGGYRNHDFCMADTSSCTMKTIRPIKFFF